MFVLVLIKKRYLFTGKNLHAFSGKSRKIHVRFIEPSIRNDDEGTQCCRIGNTEQHEVFENACIQIPFSL